MKLIIISGPPASGKSAVAKELVAKLRLGYISKDDIKEKSYDSESRTTHDYFWYEKKAKDEFFESIGESIAKGRSIVIESNFANGDKTRIKQYLNGKVRVVELFCSPKGLARFKRFVKRNEGGQRHTGHHDRRWYAWILLGSLLSYINIQWPYKPLGVDKDRLNIDTTDFSKIDYKEIINFINKA